MIYILLFSLFLSGNVWESKSTGRWLVELKSNDDHCLNDWWNETGMDQKGCSKKNLSVENWIVIESPHGFLIAIKKLPCVLQVWEDRRIDWRDTEPNDPGYINQMDMDLIGM